MEKFYVGQQVTLVPTHVTFVPILGGRRKRLDTVITKIGRKYATATIYGRDYRFGLEDGVSPDGSCAIYTAEMLADEDERAERANLLMRYGFHFFELRISREDYDGLYDYLKERGYE